jgi:putative DNA primase/helicase
LNPTEKPQDTPRASKSFMSKGERYFDKRTFVPSRLARELMRENRYITCPQDETIFRYSPDRGIYEKAYYVKKEITEKLGSLWSSRRSKQTEKCLKCLTMEKTVTPPTGIIAVRNGLLSVFTRELRPFSPDYFLINGLQWEYDKNANCPTFMRFLNEAVPDEEQQMILQEFLGYCLFPDCRFKKALILLGRTATGKSTLLRTWMEFFGEENVCGIRLQYLVTNKFARAYFLYGKLASSFQWLNVSNLKRKRGLCFDALLSGAKVFAKRKYQRAFEFNNVAKFIFEINRLPETLDAADVFTNSWLIVDFPNQFLKRNPKTDVHLVEKLTTPAEMSGVLNWALAGVKRLTTQNGFTRSGTR